jgi:hypothetical protein
MEYLDALIGCGAHVEFGHMAGYPSQVRCVVWRSSQPPEILACIGDSAAATAKALYEQALALKWLHPLPPAE